MPFVPFKRILSGITLLVLFALSGGNACALTLEELQNERRLTPSKFAKLFRDFNYSRHDEIQDPEVFLLTQSGDCDDYASLAADILRAHGYTTHLVSIRTETDVHVVCYIDETRSYLDYNNRGYFFRTVRCDDSLEKIAAKVSRSLQATWVSVAEIECLFGLKRVVRAVSADGGDSYFPWLLAESQPVSPIIIDF